MIPAHTDTAPCRPGDRLWEQARRLPEMRALSNIGHRTFLIELVMGVEAGNQSAAARRAGYAESGAAQQARRILARPEVEVAMAALERLRGEATTESGELIRDRLRRIIDADPADVLDYSIDEDGALITTKPLADVPLEVRRLCGAPTITPSGALRLAFPGPAEKLRAMDLLARMDGHLRDRVDVHVDRRAKLPEDGPIDYDEARTRLEEMLR